jgi:hypothetical protein
MKRVLITPLDWGLGHASRCVPVGRELQRQGCDILFAGSGDSLKLIRKEFAGTPCFELPGYHPRYPSRSPMIVAMARQLPRFMHVIAEEHQAVEKIIIREGVDRVISDNRYGCWSETIPTAFMTHQRSVLMPRGFGLLRPVVRALMDRMIRRFNVCWIPDLAGQDSLAPQLINVDASASRIATEYVGWLSRFSPSPVTGRNVDVLAILSGPEPQRTLFENKIVPQLLASGLKFRIVRGLPDAGSPYADRRIVDFLSAAELAEEIGSADIVIARSGYSTVMDMQAMGKKALFVPTPGQTEQEYLARMLTKKGIAFHMRQDAFDLAAALAQSGKFSGFYPAAGNALLADAVSRFIR